MDQKPTIPNLSDENRSVKKPEASQPSSNPITETLYTLTRAFACTDASISQASAEAWKTFYHSIERENVTTPDSSNGIVQGLIAGNRRFFEVLSQTLGQDCDETPQPLTPTPPPAPAAAPLSSADQRFANKARNVRLKRQPKQSS